MERGLDGRVTGTAALGKSQAYPARLGEALVEAWAAAGAMLPSSSSRGSPVQRSSEPGGRLEVTAAPAVAAASDAEFEPLFESSADSPPRDGSPTGFAASDSDSSGPWGQGGCPAGL